MSVKRKLAGIGWRVERAIDRMIVRRAGAPCVIEPYIGYATPAHLVVRGRVLSRVKANEAREGQSRIRNLVAMLRLFLTDEVADVTVRHGAFSAVSDEEGYFTLMVPRGAVAAGRVDITVTADDISAVCPVFVPDPTARFGVISDIDDTVMETGAYSLWRNLWTSMTGNTLTRKIYADAVTLMNVLHEEGRNPIFFVSSSPWNLHGFLDTIFARHGLPEAPKFLRDYGLSETQFITGTHGDHKGSAIDRILAANPALPFVLIGDTGQHDAEVYRDAVLRHPGRVTHVILRAPGRGADADDMRFVADIQAAGVTPFVGPTYDAAITALRWVA